jgi:tetratricopeptide (TPR) repeat protein
LIICTEFTSFKKAILYLQNKEDPVSAEAECRKAVEADPLSDLALSQLAQLLSHQNKTEEAIEFYNRAVLFFVFVLAANLIVYGENRSRSLAPRMKS